MFYKTFFPCSVDPENVSDRAVLDQTETMHKVGTIWSAIHNADRSTIQQHIDRNPKILDERGAVGETPLHMLFLQGKPEHLEIAKELLTEYPHIVTQVYDGQVRQSYSLIISNRKRKRCSISADLFR